MFFRSYIPGPPLVAFIDRFWLSSDAPPRPRERIPPTGTVDLVINLGEDETRIYEPSHPARYTTWNDTGRGADGTRTDERQ